MVYSNILEAVGHTPMVRLNRMVPADCADVLVKFEGLNVGGSIKTRTALNMLEDAERRGLLHPDTIIVEPTSGNQGIGLALCGAVIESRSKNDKKVNRFNFIMFDDITSSCICRR